MKFILYKLLLNLKWFCSNILRCYLVGLCFFLPMLFTSPATRLPNSQIPYYMLPYIAGLALFLAVPLWIIGFGLKKYHPPTIWRQSPNNTLQVILNVLVLTPILYTSYLIIQDSWHLNIIVPMSFSTISILFLILMNRRITNEDPELANSQPPKLTAENMTPKQLRGMRIAAVLQAVLTIIFMILYFRTNFKLDDAERELQIQQYESANINEHLQLQIDSLATELNSLKEDTIPNKR
ncbi:hypothetical protein [Ekhidna sp.]|uniref:hypothetical protein n=1 Tax=Ekhidna sp. TaxID=2608089 RepID=UPI00329A65D6